MRRRPCMLTYADIRILTYADIPQVIRGMKEKREAAEQAKKAVEHASKARFPSTSAPRM